MNESSLIFFKMIKDYYTSYLPKQKASSRQTVKAYKTSMNQFLEFASSNLNIPLSDLHFGVTCIKLVEDFLIDGEEKKHWKPATRNLKLAAIRAFYKYCANHDITLIAYYEELLTIPEKNDPRNNEIEYFSESVLKSLLEQPDKSSRKGLRNLMIMILMYDTGGRIQEILDLKLSDLHLKDDNPYVVLTGKGRKTRLVPLMGKTIVNLENYIQHFHADSDGNEYLFYTVHSGIHTQMSADTVQKFINKYCDMARKINIDVPEHIYCHMFRHSRAMHLYRNGMPLPLVSEWLGHAQVNTTREFYANADITMKQMAINKATSELNPILTSENRYDYSDDDLLKKLYGLD